LQCASDVQVDGQALAPPVHAYGLHVGAPKAPAGAGEHVPFADAPRLAAHTSQAAPHAVSQQKPSTHPAVAQTRQPETRQSAPAAASQAAPCTLRERHVPPGAQ
jgi:hypothetical protein